MKVTLDFKVLQRNCRWFSRSARATVNVCYYNSAGPAEPCTVDRCMVLQGPIQLRGRKAQEGSDSLLGAMNL